MQADDCDPAQIHVESCLNDSESSLFCARAARFCAAKVVSSVPASAQGHPTSSRLPCRFTKFVSVRNIHIRCVGIASRGDTACVGELQLEVFSAAMAPETVEVRRVQLLGENEAASGSGRLYANALDVRALLLFLAELFFLKLNNVLTLCRPEKLVQFAQCLCSSPQ